ncbi:hypothetical protein [Bacillus pumilus]|uniref:hypothetical protein n=1 Tax=Bacillus pumilus TaxID=1408 RepID=UPI001C249F6B|nr:hypothetical protein [Bacillus pumilus]MBU8607884.1 hypothetical protein [Bacillus pumilus]
MVTESKKTIMSMLILITIVLTGCASVSSIKEESEESKSKPEEVKVKTELMSDVLNKHKVWLRTSSNPGRSSIVETIIVIKGDELVRYRPDQLQNNITIEHLINLTDEEIIKLFEKAEGFKYVGKYKLGIILDQLGQTTERLKLTVNQKTMTRTEHLSAFGYGNLNREKHINDVKSGKKKIFTDAQLANSDIIKHEIKGDYSVTTNPANDEYSINIFDSFIKRTIFDTTFIGVAVGTKTVLITRTDEPDTNLNLDTPDNKGKKVIIEGITK